MLRLTEMKDDALEALRKVKAKALQEELQASYTLRRSKHQLKDAIQSLNKKSTGLQEPKNSR